MRLSLLSAVPVTAALLLATGCGDEALTRADYVKQADAICKDYKQRLGKIGNPKSIKDVGRLADETKPLVEEELVKLRELKAPDEIADDAAAAYDAIDKQLPKIDELKAAAKANDVAKIQSIATSAAKLDQEKNAKAKAIGLKVCGS